MAPNRGRGPFIRGRVMVVAAPKLTYAALWLHRASHLIGMHRAIYWGGMQPFGVRYDKQASQNIRPLVLPHVSHFMQVPFGTSLELPHSLHISAPASRVWSKLRFALLGRRKPVLGLRGFQRGRGVAVAEEGGRAGGG